MSESPRKEKKQRPQVGAKVSFKVRPTEKMTAEILVHKYHYSGRCPGIKYSYGLYENGSIVGCVIYSVPASYTLCNGVCGQEYRQYVIELSRLVIITTTPNAASFLIGRSLSQLPNHIIVSYADCNDNVGHIGYVYQATNWVYTGLSSAEPVYVLERDHPNGMKAGTPVSYTRRHIDQKARELGFDWKPNASSGPGLIAQATTGKHRYIQFSGNRWFKKNASSKLRYTQLPYPKGSTRRHNGSVMNVLDRDTKPITTLARKPKIPKKIKGFED